MYGVCLNECRYVGIVRILVGLTTQYSHSVIQVIEMFIITGVYSLTYQVNATRYLLLRICRSWSIHKVCTPGGGR